jgi:hypothetical protein
LSEGITRQDFFDLYSLVAAYQEPTLKYGNEEHSEEIRRRLAYELSYVYRDLMDQLFAIICDRLAEGPQANGDDGTSNISLFQQWRIPLNPPDQWRSGLVLLPTVDREGTKQVSYERRASFLKELVSHRQQYGTNVSFTTTDGVWAALASKYGQLINSGRDIDSLIRVVDWIFGLLHHGGRLTDYFDEKSWLEDALNIRSVGDPAQFLRYASSDVQQLLRTAAHASHTQEVSELERLGVSLNKTMGSGGAAFTSGRLMVWSRYWGYLGRCDMNGSTMNILNVSTAGKPDGFLATALTAGIACEVTELGEITVRGEVCGHHGSWSVRIDGTDQPIKTSERARPLHVAKYITDALKSKAIGHFRPLAPPRCSMI